MSNKRHQKFENDFLANKKIKPYGHLVHSLFNVQSLHCMLSATCHCYPFQKTKEPVYKNLKINNHRAAEMIITYNMTFVGLKPRRPFANGETSHFQISENFHSIQTEAKAWTKSTTKNTHRRLSKAENSNSRSLPNELVEKSKTALHAATKTLLGEFRNKDTKPWTISSSKAICSFVSKETSDAAPTTSAQRRAIPPHLKTTN